MGASPRRTITTTFAFPAVVNEKAARVVAAGVTLVGLVTLVTGWYWLTIPLALGFLARVLAGPTLSPLARLATAAVAPRLGVPKLVPGPPKRFAQAVGLVLTLSAAAAGVVFDQGVVVSGLLVVLVTFATLEAAIGFCAGCWTFYQLTRVGVIPAAACLACADIRGRPAD